MKWNKYTLKTRTEAEDIISSMMMALENVGHKSKSAVAKPVVVIMVETVKAACRTVSPSVS